jgi:hypothetical protein
MMPKKQSIPTSLRIKRDAQPEASQLDEPEAGNSLAHLEIVLEGPVDELLGAIAGIELSGFSEHTMEKLINDAVEQEFWRNTHGFQAHAKDGEEYVVFEPAYRIGYTRYFPLRGHERSFEEVEHHLRRGIRDYGFHASLGQSRRGSARCMEKGA